MFKATMFLYRPAFATTIIYMLQSVDYRPAEYLKWFWRTKDFGRVAYRKNLTPTRPARLLLLAFRAGALIEIFLSLILLVHGLANGYHSQIAYAVALFLFTPILWSHLIIVPLYLGNWLFIKPSNIAKINLSSKILANHAGVVIAIAGSYGKTTMKEILLTVLGEGKNVKATPANKNVAISHAHFTHKLNGDEDILIIEYGEGQPGDIAKFAKRTHPDVGIITGLAPAHLDKYKTLAGAAKDIFSLSDFVKKLYVSGDSAEAKPYIKKSYPVFDSHGVKDWKITDVKVGLDGLNFQLGGKKGLKLKSRLLGRHQLAPLALAAYLGRQYGLSDEQIQTGIAKIEPFEHRMKPYKLSGAWIIDDTYNGNIEGMKAGLKLLAELKAKRKIYITPGLVDQGAEEEKIHVELGRAISKAKPDEVILMKHSVTDAIIEGLSGYSGKLVIEDDPLNFYTHLDRYVATGDLVLMQNDWPDNYN